MYIKVKKLNEMAIIPERQTVGSAGADLHACVSENVIINPGETIKIPTGIAIEMRDSNMVALIFARSGLATKYGIAPANAVGVIDYDYRGEIIVALHNNSNQPHVILPLERIAQLVITPIIESYFVEVNTLEETDRGDGGFGSTGTT